MSLDIYKQEQKPMLFDALSEEMAGVLSYQEMYEKFIKKFAM